MKERVLKIREFILKKYYGLPYDYIIYTDGGCMKNPGGAGGIGVAIFNMKEDGNRVQIIKRGYRSTTNNRMEMMAVLYGLQKIPKEARILVISDSQYVIQSITLNYRKKANVDLWEPLLREIERIHSVEFKWTKGHNNDLGNELCDSLASEAMLGKLNIDDGYENIPQQMALVF